MYIISETAQTIKLGVREFIGNVVIIQGYRCTHVYGQYHKINKHNKINEGTRYDTNSHRFIKC